MTMQTPDLMIWKNVEHSIIAGIGLLEAFPDISFPKFEFMSTNCWRGYIATWIIDDEGGLRLARIGCGIHEEVLDDDNVEVEIGAVNQLDTIFSNYDGPITALGFTGDVTVGYGDDIQSNGRYAVTYPYYRVFSFEVGKLTNYEEHDRAWVVKDHEVSSRLRDFLRNQNEN